MGIKNILDAAPFSIYGPSKAEAIAGTVWSSDWNLPASAYKIIQM